MNLRGFPIPSIVRFLLLILSSTAVLDAAEFFHGDIEARPHIVMTGVKPELVWSVTPPDDVGADDYTVFLRQVQYTAGIVYDIQLPSPSGTMLSPLSTDPGASRFELWAVRHEPLVSYLLDTTLAGVYVPLVSVAFRSEDPYGPLPRTRADRPFHVDVTVGGLLGDGDVPETMKRVDFLRHAQSYGPGGNGAGINGADAELISRTPVTANGTHTFTYEAKAIPGEDPDKLRGMERFSVFSVEDSMVPATQIASGFIQIWPVADASIEGISEGQEIGPDVPRLTLALRDLYPDSSTWARVYKGPPREGAVGTIVPGTSVLLSTSVPGDRVMIVENYGSVFDSDGQWTLEVVTRTPFGTDPVTAVTFTMRGLGMTVEAWRREIFGSTENSGDGANLHDFDHDGLPNLIEFAFGLDPEQDSVGMLPAFAAEGEDIVVRFTAPPGLLGVGYGAQWSADLAPDSWKDIPDSGVPPGHEFRIVRGTGAPRFLRLTVRVP